MILASVMGAFVVYAFIGPQPAFSLPAVNSVSWLHYLVLPVVALATALVGVVFQRSILALRGALKGKLAVPRWSLPLVGAFVTWVIGSAVYLATHKTGVFGLGYGDLSEVLNNHFLWWVAGIMVAAKLVATIFSYSFGGAGGIFSPLLFLGGMGGFFISGLFSLWIPMSPADTMALAATGMATCLGTVLRTPLSCLLIVFEMTHQFAMVPGLLLGLLISTLVARLAGPHNFYDALLVQDGHHFHQIHPPTDFHSWKQQPIGSLATPRPVTLEADRGELWHKTIDAHPYRVFPVVRDGRPVGALIRNTREVLPVAVFKPEDPLEAAEAKFLETSAGVVLVVGADGMLTGLVTLHDLLRAQASLGD
jgi:CIC family chloride channel protein